MSNEEKEYDRHHKRELSDAQLFIDAFDAARSRTNPCEWLLSFFDNHYSLRLSMQESISMANKDWIDDAVE